ncbi:MAG: Asp-tRNA(Asn)/Glu-tRNA(Gln) amidotransferase subunit GatC [Gammaproteobacteria bacterium]
MPLQAEGIEKLCELARLEVTDAEMADFTGKLSRIVELVDQLQAVDTSATAPLAHPLAMPQRLRPDAVTEIDEHERFQRNAAEVESGLYLVPKVIE